MKNKTSRLIIETQDGITLKEALPYIEKVIQGGRVSEARGRKHFCWLTVWDNGIVVSTRRKRSDRTADSLVVYKQRKYGEYQ